MSAGDIHNHNGSICKASKKPCPFGADGHSKDVDSYVDYHVEHSGVDGDQVRAMISDGTPPADAVDVAKAGLTAWGSSLSKDQLEEENEINEDAFGHIKNLSGEAREKAIEEAERNLAKEYVDGLEETALEGESVEELNSMYMRSLAAIHDVSANRVNYVANGEIEVDRKDGSISVYNAEFERIDVVDGYESDAHQNEVNEETYRHIRALNGAEKNTEKAKALQNLADERADAEDEADYMGDKRTQEREYRRIKQIYGTTELFIAKL